MKSFGLIFLCIFKFKLRFIIGIVSISSSLLIVFIVLEKLLGALFILSNKETKSLISTSSTCSVSTLFKISSNSMSVKLQFILFLIKYFT